MNSWITGFVLDTNPDLGVMLTNLVKAVCSVIVSGQIVHFEHVVMPIVQGAGRYPISTELLDEAKDLGLVPIEACVLVVGNYL